MMGKGIFSDDFKRNVVAQITTERGYRVAEVATSLGVRELRFKIQTETSALRLDYVYISRLAGTVYEHVRTNAKLGPVFNTAIPDWEPHSVTIKRFWASVASSAGEYSGKPVPTHHTHVEATTPAGYKTSLAMFQKTLKGTAFAAAARGCFAARADRIANSVRLAMFNEPELGRTRHD
ncbi:globin [Henriciella barbarensis]|uniref:Globin n=1 Tax=Henriciella barbarensis TaxID=86342 RepID=A0A399QQR5_9PROT|nr:globin [Henriciella barbarensis]RIJ20811.1 globin [Henriciella barbarensis]